MASYSHEPKEVDNSVLLSGGGGRGDLLVQGGSPQPRELDSRQPMRTELSHLNMAAFVRAKEWSRMANFPATVLADVHAQYSRACRSRGPPSRY